MIKTNKRQSTYWERNVGEKRYGHMIARHRGLWKYIRQFIKDKNINSIVDVGCGGKQPARKWVDTYIGIDINESVDAIHEDFLKMDLNKIPRCELLLAAGVIEHVSDWKKLLERIKDIEFSYALVTFFNGVKRKKEVIKRTRCKIYVNKLSQEAIDEYLKTIEAEYSWKILSPRDAVLLIRDKK
jgi:hypothetical protein